MPSGGDSKLLSISDAAKVIGVDRRVVGEIVRRRKIPHSDLGTVKLIGSDAIEEIQGVLSPPNERIDPMSILPEN